MTPERWRQITEAFHAALTRDAAARASYLEQACADDGALREEVEAMLAAHAVRSDVLLATSPRLAAGTMIGPYRVADLIGPAKSNAPACIDWSTRSCAFARPCNQGRSILRKFCKMR